MRIKSASPSHPAFRGLAASFGIGIAGAAGVAEATTFTVIDTNGSGAGSLRQALTDANAAASPPRTITPVSELPAVTVPVVIDGTTQPGFAGALLISEARALNMNQPRLERSRSAFARLIAFSATGIAAALLVARAEAGVTITEFPVALSGGGAVHICTGSDGNLWFADYTGNRIGRISTSGLVTEFPVPTPNGVPYGIASGPDGNIWFTEANGNKIGRITPAGVVTEFTIPTAASQPVGIASGSDGNLWFAEYDSNKIGRITTAGVITEFTIPTPSGGPWGIASGPDGNLWFTEDVGNKIGRITTAGVVTEFTIPTANSQPAGIAPGAAQEQALLLHKPGAPP